ncbi:BON domain-containing protein [Ottowia sp.]|uniref:BON domain-containing protein n=1 Tax=Ottowia sp. TaxID=1898956 RepID=UPI003A87FCEE
MRYQRLTPPSAPRTPAIRGLVLCALALTTLAACSGGTPWGATPQNLPQVNLNLPSVENISARIGASTNTGSQQLAERVRGTLMGQSALAGAQLGVEGFEGGLIVLSGQLAHADQRALALSATRSVPGVGDVVDRMTTAP